MKSLFQNQIVKYTLQTNVQYCLVVSGNEKIQVLKYAHYILVPTYHFTERKSISIIEAMAYGVVPICTSHRDLK